MLAYWTPFFLSTAADSSKMSGSIHEGASQCSFGMSSVCFGCLLVHDYMTIARAGELGQASIIP